MNQQSVATTAQVASFYDEFSQRLLNDYLTGNPRFERAAARVLASIGPETRTVLDMGCGAGVSSMLIKQAYPHVQVTGVDISPENIRIARSLFADRGIEFKVSDLRDEDVVGKYDLIAMVDVHEHIPRGDWQSFHQSLRELLSKRGKLVITYPSEMHQEYLADHDPEGLQVVDETIRLADLQEMERRIDARLVTFAYVTIWARYDYVHAVFDRDLERREASMEKRSFIDRVVNRLRRRWQGYSRRRYVDARLKRLTDSCS